MSTSKKKKPSIPKVSTFGSSAIMLSYEIRRFPSLSHDRFGFIG
jgi:hypothetical protein